MKQKGVTMIEALIASTMIGLSMIGYMQYKKMEMEDNFVKEFEYDLRKVLQGFENKLINDKMIDKKYWSSNEYDNNLNDHLIKNLTDKSKDCNNLSTLDLDGKNYITCIPPLRMNFFDVNTTGNIKYYSNDTFKSHSFNFTPKNSKNLKKINILSRSIKKVFNDVKLYSNVDFFIKNERTTYTNCLKEFEYCYLRITFGTNIDYLDKENIISVKTSNNIENEMNVYSSSNNYLNKEYINNEKTNVNKQKEVKTNNEYDERDQRDNLQILRDQLKNNGLELTNKEFDELKDQIKKIEENPELMERIQKNIERSCSHYDEDDYYFMSIYDKNNICYKNYGK